MCTVIVYILYGSQLYLCLHCLSCRNEWIALKFFIIFSCQPINSPHSLSLSSQTPTPAPHPIHTKQYQNKELRRHLGKGGANTNYSKMLLAKDVLAEIPKQLVTWMKFRGHRPQALSSQRQTDAYGLE